jgi:integrase
MWWTAQKGRSGEQGEANMIFKRGTFYWYEFLFSGKRYRASTKVKVGRGVPGQANPKEKAKQVEAAKRTRLALSAAGIDQRDPAPIFVDFTKRFLKWIDVEKEGKPGTAKFYHDMTRLLLKFEGFKNAKLDEIDEALITKYIELRRGAKRAKVQHLKDGGVKITSTNRPLATASINRELATLRRILRVAHEWKVIPSVPVIHLLPGEAQSDRVLTQQEEETYLGEAQPLLKDFATIALDTGMRPDEILRIRWENVRFQPVGDAKYGYIHNPYGKTPRAKRNLPMTSRVFALVQNRHELAGKPLVGFLFPQGQSAKDHVSYNTVKLQHRVTMRSLTTLNHFRLYDLRHTLLTRLGESNADAFAIQKIAGHSTITISQRYVHPTSERVEDAFSRLEVYNARKAEELRLKRESAEAEKSRMAMAG